MNTIDVLYQARSEIVQLRRQNEILRAKVEVIETISMILQPKYYPTQPMCPDVIYMLDELNKELQEKQLNKIKPKQTDEPL